MGIYHLDIMDLKNNDSAIYWLSKTSNSGCYVYGALAQEKLGGIFTENKLVKADTLKGILFYKRSCACNEKYSRVTACRKVVKYYQGKADLTDSTELLIYQELEKQLTPILTGTPIR